MKRSRPGYEIAVDEFARQMKIKLRKKASEGYSGWDYCDPKRLFNLMESHVARGPGQVVDIANFAMMVWHNLRRLERKVELK